MPIINRPKSLILSFHVYVYPDGGYPHQARERKSFFLCSEIRERDSDYGTLISKGKVQKKSRRVFKIWFFENFMFVMRMPRWGAQIRPGVRALSK